MFKHLETFFAVFEGRSFTKAAEKLFISQPTVSVHIRQLEAELHMKLFERNGRSEIVPTANGEKLYQKLIIMQNEWRKAIFEISQEQQEKSVLRIMTTELASSTFLPDIIALIKQTVPTLAYQITIAPIDVINTKLTTKQFDLFLSEKEINHLNFECIPAFNDELVLVGEPDSTEWIVPNLNHPDYSFFQTYFREHDLFIDSSINVNDDFTRLSLVAHKVGKTIISKALVTDNISSMPLDSSYSRPIYLTYPNQASDAIISDAIKIIAEKYKDSSANH
ncbi:LysR family transcriptional regulator [Periweissella fabalis]|uniref:LysR family transcriptional regulator n=1 Tax=Periweissella fabalis TaxID=1070421 RepID=A0A7X6N4X0_9LACO|nr:LysR family transcriptional regulator [Periweissella fabalis]MCM0598159.1 LysR family transcriptional regulator [Periweissella fabalis]NKZ24717.1 LysR family transcriptional regulator [Periweissella fabalis]